MKQTKDWIVYILRCSDSSLYTGITKDLSRRLDEHNSGSGSKYTRAHGPCNLVWSNSGFTESGAKKEEARIKKLTREQKETLIRS